MCVFFVMQTRVQCVLCVVIVSMKCRQSEVGEKRDTFPGVCVCVFVNSTASINMFACNVVCHINLKQIFVLKCYGYS